VLGHTRGLCWCQETLPNFQQVIATWTLKDKADFMFRTNLIPDAERDASHKSNRNGSRQLGRWDPEGIDPGTHDVGGSSVLTDVVR
jgi:hypothetical protein